MEGEKDEIKALIKVSTTVLISLTFCHFIARKIPQGVTRLVSILPVVSIFTFLPLLVSSVHFTVHCLLSKLHHSYISSLLLVSLFRSNKKPPEKAYFTAEILLALSAVPGRVLFGYEIEPQFEDPYLATSLQDFWGKRWNLMISGILRPTVYLPIRSICTPIVGRNGALIVGLVMTFVVSGLMHELLYFYATRVRPTWEVTSFFVLQGVCTALEIMAKKKFGQKWRLPHIVSRPLTVGFVMITGCWLFFAQIVRNEMDLKVQAEYGELAQFIKSVGLRGSMVLHHIFS